MARLSIAASIVGLVWSCACLQAQVAVSGRVLDETGAAVTGARVAVSNGDTNSVTASSDLAGNFRLALASAGSYRIVVERQGFYVFRSAAQAFETGANQLTITLNHQQQFSERVDVTASPAAIDPQQPADRSAVDNAEVQSLPFPGSQDYRNSLRLLNDVLQDTSGHYHLNGAASGQTGYTMDGFNIANPVSGQLEARVNVDSLRFVNVENSRGSADSGRGSAGSVALESKMGDDRLRFGGTNFIPGVGSGGGFHLNHWTPRMEVSGPIHKGRAWFYDGADAYYSNDTISGLPRGQNRTAGTTFSDITRFQVDLTPSNVVTASGLLNISDTSRAGLSFVRPAEATTDTRQMLVMSSIRDQQYFHGGSLIEVGFADTRGFVRSLPQGVALYQITPFGVSGNYFVNLDEHFYRQQGIADLFLPTLRFHGTHQLKLGVDLERESFHQQTIRRDYEVLDSDGTLLRHVSFMGNPFARRKNFEGAEYFQDHWTPRDGLAVEAGVRVEWNEIVRDLEVAPRFSVAWTPAVLHGTKFSAGWGIYYDALSLGLLAQNQGQTSLATFYLSDGTVQGPIATSFLVFDHLLEAPYYRTASFGVERKLPAEIYARMGYTHRTGEHGLVFAPTVPEAGAMYYQGATFLLNNTRRDRYDAFDISFKRTFARQFEWAAGYTYSRSRTNADVEYNLENPIFAVQAPGPLHWDAPHRVHLWGWAPFPSRALPPPLRFLTRNTTAALMAESRSGFPFDVVNQSGFLVGSPGSMRYPYYFSAAISLERQFRAMHYLWALRAGVDNLTNNSNPNAVNNVTGTPQFLAYGHGPRRALNVRLRFLGRK